MFDSVFIELLHQRMAQLGFKKFKWEPVRFESATNSGTIAASNEYYFLVANSVPATLLIISDTSVFNEGAKYNSFNIYQFKEFTGQIFISQTPVGAMDLEFVRVIPVIENIAA